MGIQNDDKIQSFNILKLQRYIDCDLITIHYVRDNLIVVKPKPFSEFKEFKYNTLAERLRAMGFLLKTGRHRLYYLTNDETIDIADEYRKLGYGETNQRIQKLIEQNLVTIHNINEDCSIVHLNPIKEFIPKDHQYMATFLRKNGFKMLNHFDRIHYKSNNNVDYIIDECVKLGYCVRNVGYDDINPRMQNLIAAELVSFHHINGNVFITWSLKLRHKHRSYLHRWFKSKNYILISGFRNMRIRCLINNINTNIEHDCYELTVKLGLRDSEEERKKKYDKKRKLNSQRPEIKKRKRDQAKQPKYKQKRSINRSNKYKTDDLYKLTEYMRWRINMIIKKQGYKKNSQTHQILGCSFEEFKQHIEKLFEPWMNWDNHGKYKKGKFNVGWDFDHIIPLASIKLLPLEERVNRLYELNHYTNFRPLCSKINRDIKRDQFDITK